MGQKDNRQFWPYASAWLATLVTGPLLVALVMLVQSGGDPSMVTNVFGVGWVFWGFPATVGGALAWPVVRDRLARIRPEPIWRAQLMRIGLGLAAGAIVGALIGLAPILMLATAYGPVALAGLPGFMGIGGGIGAITGLIWAAWFVAFDVLIRPKP